MADFQNALYRQGSGQLFVIGDPNKPSKLSWRCADLFGSSANLTGKV